jgi:hypothetical protein
VQDWGILFCSTFLINHFDLFGLRQVILAFRNKAYARLDFTTPVLCATPCTSG